MTPRACVGRKAAGVESHPIARSPARWAEHGRGARSARPGTMRNPISAVAAVASLFVCVILAGACLQSPEASPPTEQVSDQTSEPGKPVGEAPEPTVWVGAPYGPEDFSFKVEKKWDGKDGAGGRQRALKLFVFCLREVPSGRVKYSWECPIDVFMPVQSQMVGSIPPERAAVATAQVANKVVPALSHSRADWEGQGAVFCIQLKDKMNDTFSHEYKGYGAKVTQWLR
jgi:hypothetical protein